MYIEFKSTSLIFQENWLFNKYVILLILAFGHYIMVCPYFKRKMTNSKKKKSIEFGTRGRYREVRRFDEKKWKLNLNFQF